MFRSARVKLTLWYSLIIMIISLAFSVVIFRVLTSELDRVERMQRIRIEGRVPSGPPMMMPLDNKSIVTRFVIIDPELVEETKSRLISTLAFINVGILLAAGTTGYFLAGKTLKPIQVMMDEQSRFITDASHELRTPLTALKSEIEVTLRDKALTLAEAKDVIASNLEEVNRLQSLTDGLITLTRYPQTNHVAPLSQLPINEPISLAIKKITPLARQKSITIQSKVGKQSVIGDVDSLTELFVIFLDNAIKYSGEKTEIVVNTKQQKGFVFVSISDQGQGIATEDIPHIFDRFFRADSSRTSQTAHGYGLGLSIAKQILDRHQATILVKSTVGKGSTFTLKFPLHITKASA
jgi:two-component system, OmpR family, sensor histidine kinase CiaH